MRSPIETRERERNIFFRSVCVSHLQFTARYQFTARGDFLSATCLKWIFFSLLFRLKNLGYFYIAFFLIFWDRKKIKAIHLKHHLKRECCIVSLVIVITNWFFIEACWLTVNIFKDHFMNGEATALDIGHFSDFLPIFILLFLSFICVHKFSTAKFLFYIFFCYQKDDTISLDVA